MTPAVPPVSQAVAVIGLGSIGSAIARNTLAAGLRTWVADIRQDAVDEHVARGALGGASPGAAAAAADLVAVAVVTDEQVREVLLGPAGVLAAARPGTVVLIHSTVRLSTVREVEAAARDTGVAVLDAGVSTQGGAADSGRLAVFVGGEQAALERVRPALDTYSHSVTHLGALGAGMAAKLLRNLLGYVIMAGASEVIALAEAIGMDISALEEVIRDSGVLRQGMLPFRAGSAASITQSDQVAEYLSSVTGLGGADLVAFATRNSSLMVKDVAGAVELADEVGVSLRYAAPTIDSARQVYHLPPEDVPEPADRTDGVRRPTEFERGAQVMRELYAGDVAVLPEGSSAYSDVMMRTLMAQVWGRDVLPVRDRRLLVLGVIAGLGNAGTWKIQARAALKRGELTLEELQETLIMLTPYAGYPNVANLMPAFAELAQETVP